MIAEASGAAGIAYDWHAMMFPLFISPSGLVGGVLTMLVVNFFYKVAQIEDGKKALKGVLVISTANRTLFVYCLTHCCLPAGGFLIAVGPRS